MTTKQQKIADMLEPFLSGDDEPHYAAYLDCFNRRKYFEAHEVLEELWLEHRGGPDDAFEKGLIQLAGAFVHLQKGRLGPAASLFRLAESNLSGYGPVHGRLDVAGVVMEIRRWLGWLEEGGLKVNPLTSDNAPRLAWQTNR